MKITVIASSEYSGNMPDLFLMDEKGNYYGVTNFSYAVIDGFPKDANHWVTRPGSDEGRHFNIDTVEIDESLVKRFDELTKEYARLDAATPTFAEKYPMPGDFKTKKAYKAATDEWDEKHFQWAKENYLIEHMHVIRMVWDMRNKLFASFSEKVYQAIKYHDYFKF